MMMRNDADAVMILEEMVRSCIARGTRAVIVLEWFGCGSIVCSPATTAMLRQQV